MDKFIRCFKEACFESEVYLRLVRIEESDENLFIQFNVHLEDNNEVIQEWRVGCSRISDYNLTLDFINDIDVHTEHVLLWDENQEHCHLFFNGKPANPRELVGAMYTKHQEITQGWITFGTFLNGLGSVEKLLAGGYGLLAKGPKELLNSYKEVIEEYGISASLLPMKQYPPQDGPFQVLVFSKSYVIAKSFSFDLLSDKNTVKRP